MPLDPNNLKFTTLLEEELDDIIESNVHRPEIVREFFYLNRELVTEVLDRSFSGYIKIFRIYGLDLLDFLKNQELRYIVHVLGMNVHNCEHFWTLIHEAISEVQTTDKRTNVVE